MKEKVAIIAVCVAMSSVAAPEQYADRYEWPSSLWVKADLDGSGGLDTVQLGVAKDRVGLLVTMDSKPMPVIDIPINGSQHFGICAGSPPGIEVRPQSAAPLNALEEWPKGYLVCKDCVEIVVNGGDCDPLHFYWDRTSNRLAWWRARATMGRPGQLTDRNRTSRFPHG